MHNSLKKVLSVLLAAVMLISVFSVNVSAAVIYDETTKQDDYYNLVSKKDWETAPGISESEIVLNNDAGSYRQVIHVMQADMTNPYAKVITSYAEMNTQKYQTADMYAQTTWIRDNWGLNVVGGMNTCLSWYNGDTYTKNPDRIGEPLGFMMLDGEVLFDHSVGFPTCIVINYDEKDGVKRPADIPKVEMVTVTSTADLDGWEEQVIPCSSGYIVKDGKNQYTESHTGGEPRSVVGIKADGTVVAMENDGRQSPYSSGMNMYELAEVMISLGCTYAANCDGGGSSTFVTKRPGEELAVQNSPSDGSLRPTTNGIVFISTAPADGTFNRAHITAADEYYTPGSSVQFDVIGTDLAGNAAEIPEDVIWQLKDSKFGTVDSNGKFTSNGTTGEVTVQMVYNDEVVGEATINIVVPDIAFKMDKLVLPYSETAEINLSVTTNEGLNTVTTSAGDIILTLSDAKMGTIDGNLFTTCTQESGVTGGTLTATLACDPTKTVSATVKFGKASEIVFDFENNYELIVDKSTTGKNEDGSYIYGWHVNDIQRDQHFAYRWTSYKARSPIGIGTKHELKVVDKTTGKVRNGNNALEVHLDWTWTTSMGSKQINIWFPEAIDVSEATNFGMWLYIPNYEVLADCATFRLQGRTIPDPVNSPIGTGKSQDIKFSNLLANCGVTDEGWIYVNYDVLLNGWDVIDYFQIMMVDNSTGFNSMSDYTFYIDDVTVDYSEAVIDRENPYFTSMGIANDQDGANEIVDGAVITENAITVLAQAKENTTKVNYTGLNTKTAKVYVDSKQVTTGITTNASGKISAALNLADGVHTIRFEICDEQGNLGAITRKVTVNTEKSPVRLELADPTATEIPAGAIMYLNLVADDITKIDEVTTNINLDQVNEWELEGMEVAYGFEATYTVDGNNNAKVTIKRVLDEIEGTTNVLAKLPVRIWMTKSYLDPEYIALDMVQDDPAKQDKYFAMTPYGMWLSDGVFKINVVVDADAGLVKYTDGTEATFSSNEYVVTTELNRYRNSKNAGDTNFYQDKASFHIHKAGEPVSKAATCTEAGYTDRVFCVGCTCDTVKRYNHVCDTDAGCGSVIDWGTTVPAKGHDYKAVNNELVCDCGKKFSADGFVEFNGKTMYFAAGKYLTGYQRIMTDYYLFDENGFACDGEYNVCGTSLTFDNGKFIATEDVLFGGMCGDDIWFALFQDGRLILDGSGAMYDYAAIRFAPWYNDYRDIITSIKISKDITAIGTRAFYNMKKLTSITFEEGSKLTALRQHSIAKHSSLEEVVIPDGVTLLDNGVFELCPALKKVQMPAKVSYIASTAFADSIDATYTVVVDSLAETWAKNKGYKYETRIALLNSGSLNETITWELYSDGTLKIVGEGAMPDYAAVNGTTSAPWGNLKVKKIVVDKYITRIGSFAFFMTNASSVEFEDGSALTEIGKSAFGYMDNLTAITIPSKVEKIEKYAFYYCPVIETLFIPVKVTSIGGSILYGSNDDVVMQVAKDSYAQAYAETNGIKFETREEYAVVNGGKLTDTVSWEYYSDGTLKIVGEGAMPNYAAVNGTTSAPWGNLKVNKIVVGKDITKIGEFAFFMTNASSVEFEDGSELTEIGKAAFGYMNNLTAITLPSKVEKIEKYAFYYCPVIETVFIPVKVTSIGGSILYSSNDDVVMQVAKDSYAHSYAESKGIKFETREEYAVIDGGQLTDTVSWEFYSDGTLNIVGEGAMPDYAAVNGTTSAPWGNLKVNKIVIGKDITKIGEFAFFMTNASSVEFEDGSALIEIGKAAFGYMSKLKSIVLPQSLETIAKYAFYYCPAIESIYVPLKVAFIGGGILSGSNTDAVLQVAKDSYAHSYAESKGIKFETREEYAVINGGKITDTVSWEYYSDGTLKIVGEGAMVDYAAVAGYSTAPWANLEVKKVVIGKDITYVGAYAFFKNTAAAVEFEDESSLVEIGKAAFGYMNNLTSVILPETVTTIGKYAFYYCPAIETIYVPASVTYISSSILSGSNANAVMKVAEGSYAHDFAIAKGITFELY